MQFPAVAAIFLGHWRSAISHLTGAARQLAPPGLQNPATRGSTEAACHFQWGRGRQVMHLPRKQVDVGATHRLHQFAGENRAFFYPPSSILVL